MKLVKPKTVWWPTWQGWTFLFLIPLGLFIFLFLNAHHFLAITIRVPDADILVVEDWMPEVVILAAAKEFMGGKYRYLLISGPGEQDSRNRLQNAGKTTGVNQLVSLGIPKDRILECFASPTDSHRSAAMARSVGKAFRQEGIGSKGVNVMAPSTHARKTWLVHRRALGPEAPVGIVSVPTSSYDQAKWWKTSQGAKSVIIQSAGFLYEWIAGS